jgi:hypothetical protein
MLVTAGMANTGIAQGQYGNNDTSLRDLIRRIQTRETTFNSTAQNALSRSNISSRSRDELNGLIADFETSVNQLNRRSYNSQATQTEVRTVLERAALINNFLLNNRLGYGAQRDWDLVRGDLDQLAQVYNMNWQWNSGSVSGPSGNSGYGDSNLSDTQIRQLLQHIDSVTSNFSRSFRQDLNRRNDRNGLDEARRQLSEFESATALLRSGVNSRQINSGDVRNLLERAAFLNSYVTDHPLGYQTKSNWDLLRQDLDRLASAYNIAWNWSAMPAPASVYGTDTQLTGTYRINTTQGDDARRIAENATRSLPTTDRQRVYDSLLRRLDPPQTLAIDRQGSNVTIASSRAPQINFVADGIEHVETNQNGRTVRVRASLTGNQLSIARSGERAQDFTVTFEPIDRGRRLLVTRRLYSDQISQPVTVRTYYDKISDVAQLNIYESNPDNGNGTVGTTSGGEFVIPNGTQLVAVLNTNLSTQAARDNDRFTMTVRSPGQYEGAIIEGYVTNVDRGGRVTGRADMTLNFDSIRMRDGRTNRFAGILDSVRTPDGQNVRVDNEGAVREGTSQTTRTVQRAAIGTAVGAIIGAIAGGGKGAAIGAVLGAGAGAGSVYVQGRNDLELNTGTEVTIRATGPRN